MAGLKNVAAAGLHGDLSIKGQGIVLFGWGTTTEEGWGIAGLLVQHHTAATPGIVDLGGGSQVFVTLCDPCGDRAAVAAIAYLAATRDLARAVFAG